MYVHVCVSGWSREGIRVHSDSFFKIKANGLNASEAVDAHHVQVSKSFG